jgi:3-oxoacyl-[acyl-carrier-protein] synthase II
MRRRVVVTGAGVISSIATGREEFWDALQAMRSGAKVVELDRYGSIGAFPAPEDDGAEERFGRKNARRMDRAGRLGAVAAALALEDAGDLGLASERIGCAIGSAHGGADTTHEAYETFFERGADRMSPFAVPLGLPNTAASAVARQHALHGPSTSIGTACAAGSDAIGAAFRLVRDGYADAMVAGGADAAITPFLIAGYKKLGALSPGLGDPLTLSRPFDRARDGFVMGEGAGILVLEDRERAEARGARILAEVSGFGQSCDAGHLTDPDETGAGPARAVRLALADAGLEPSQIGYVNAHATSTPAGDIAELRALAAAGLSGAAISSTKSLHGHALGAAGGIEAVAALMALVRGVLPGGANLDDPETDPPADLLREPRPAKVDAVLSNSFGFGGHNAAVVFTRA